MPIRRIAAFTATLWAAAALLYYGQHSVAIMAVTAVIVLGGLDLFVPAEERE